MIDDEKIDHISTGLSAKLAASKINSHNEDSMDQRVFKKASSNQLLTLYLGSRDIEIKQDQPNLLSGIAYIDQKIIEMAQKVFCQLTLTFRYGREDEEVMGLKFCNEVIIALKQIWPQISEETPSLSPLQNILIERLGSNSIPFTIEIEKEIPASVQLLPAKRYTGSPIGTSYDLRIYAVSNNTETDEKIQKRYTIRLGIKLIHRIDAEIDLLKKDLVDLAHQSSIPRLRMKLLSPKARKLIKQTSLILQIGNCSSKNIRENQTIDKPKSEVEIECPMGPSKSLEKPFLWTEGKINLRASLDKKMYSHGEKVNVTIELRNDSKKVVRKIRVFIVQYVDVCMFSNGKFKNVVAETEVDETIEPTQIFHETFSLLPVRGATKNWIAVEGALFSSNSHHDHSLEALNSKLASSTPQRSMHTMSKLQQKGSLHENKLFPFRHHTVSNVDDEASGCSGNYTEKNVFAINVSYYVKIKLIFGSIGGDLSLKLPFYLGNMEQDKKEDNALNASKKDVELSPNTCEEETLSKFRQSDSSASELDIKSPENKQKNVVQAQVHERKYLESEI